MVSHWTLWLSRLPQQQPPGDYGLDGYYYFWTCCTQVDLCWVEGVDEVKWIGRLHWERLGSAMRYEIWVLALSESVEGLYLMGRSQISGPSWNWLN